MGDNHKRSDHEKQYDKASVEQRRMRKEANERKRIGGKTRLRIGINGKLVRV